ncbi:SDR family NAD(P)-dependent oxidoreductase [Novosphingobium sp. KN65.2]|uniref:SDR family NAD(P)-dependent oxidoreductase n=1 Tax=Novosphingobium sp. KN65.2 TaxID=1478134 RepID=UPI0005EA57FA|nr:glucose 1-dehydrogenase [Novosphingobium sp. KN65.2]CDO34473.1 3-alpha-(or 20-beta)-hydroxysteroid dehydrogenase [Novosphingobium sp. KN65.2]
MNRLEGKVALVTGGSRGIGEGIVRRFVEEGARVMLTDVLVDEGAALASQLGDAARFLRHDVTSRTDWNDVIAGTEEAFGRIDVLVNNAGVIVFKAFEDLSEAEIDRLIDINLKGVINGCQAVVPALERAGGGAIVNMSSADGISGANGVTVYCATKFAVRGLTKALAMELGPRKIRVNSIHPGGIYTPLANPMNAPKAEYDKGFWIYPAQCAGEPSDIGAAAAYLASEDARYCMGTELSVDGGLNAGHYYMGMPGSPTPPQG